MTTVDGQALKYRYQVWFVESPPNAPFATEVRDLADAWVVLNAVSFFSLAKPDRVVSDSVGGVNVWDQEWDDGRGEWVTWHDPETDMEWEEFEARVQDLMEVELQRVEPYHYPTIKKYMDYVLKGERA